MRPPRSADHERGTAEIWGLVATAVFPEWTGQPSASAQGLPGRRALHPPRQQDSHVPSYTFQTEDFQLTDQRPGLAGLGLGGRP